MCFIPQKYETRDFLTGIKFFFLLNTFECTQRVLVRDFKEENSQVQSGDNLNRKNGATRASKMAGRRGVSTTDRLIIIQI